MAAGEPPTGPAGGTARSCRGPDRRKTPSMVSSSRPAALRAAPAVALTVGLAGCGLAHQTPHGTPSPATSTAPAGANPADLVRKAGFTVDPGSESGRPAPGDARFANGQLSTIQGTEILSLLVFESTQKRDASAASLTRSGPDFSYVIGDRLVA